MELKRLKTSSAQLFQKYKFVILIIIIGIILMIIPTTSKEEPTGVVVETKIQEDNTTEDLATILSQIKGVGNVRVYLTTLEGAQTIYQTDEDITSQSTRSQTVTTTDAQRNQEGLVIQVNPPIYRGAIIVCEGANDPAVRLAVTEAVANVTGLGANRISVLKMK